MKSRLLPTLCVALCASTLLCAQTGRKGSAPERASRAELGLPPDARQLQIGDPAPDFRLPGVDGKTYSLANFTNARVLMVAFLANHCPASHAVEDRLHRLLDDHAQRGFALVAISPNHPDAVRLDELGYSNYNDSFEEMKLYARERGFRFPYLYDGDTQSTAKAYGCLATPQVFVFDAARRLRYLGRVDDSRFPDPATVQSPDARQAVEALLDGRPVPVEVTKPFGCSVKWRSKIEEVRAVGQKADARPVTLERIDAAGVAALASNATEKVRLINVWATWCVPCVKEFPDLMLLNRRFANRDFELITLSVDAPEDEAKVRAFLEKYHVVPSNRQERLLTREGRTSNNYLFTGANLDALMAALDPAWAGPLPHTVVIAPGGKIVYRHTGPVDRGELQSRVLAELGVYYK